MTVFLLRLFVFAGLWGLLIVQYSISNSISLLFFAGALGLYFFLSLKQRYLPVYYILSGMIVLHSYLMTEDNLITILIVMSVVAVAAFRFDDRSFFTYTIVTAVLLTGLSIIQGNDWLEMIVMSLFLLFMSVLVNRFAYERQTQRDLYDELLSEYQRLKQRSQAADRTVRLEERTRIARDIHDSVGHRLTSLIMKLETLAIQENNPEYRSLKQLADDSLKETRQAVRTLQSEEQEGIATVIQLIRKLEAESHIVIQFTIKEGVLSVPLSNAKSVVLYRVLQEALTNVMRHGQTREVQMALGRSAVGNVSFEVTNTYHAAEPIEMGFGLRNMKARVEELNGTLQVNQINDSFVLSGTIPADDS